MRPVNRLLMRSRAGAVAMVASLACFMSISETSAQSGREPLQRRPLIVLIHGRAQEYQVSSLLQQAWVGALFDGLAKIGLDQAIRPSDVEFVHYEFVTESDPTVHPMCTGSIRNLPQDQGGTFLHLPFNLQWFLYGTRGRGVVQVRDGVSKYRFIQRATLSSLPDVVRYLSDTIPPHTIQCEYEAPLIAKLSEAREHRRPVILVAHSLGSLISYRVLNAARLAHPEDPNYYDVRRFVTFGSQLNISAARALLEPHDSVPPMPNKWTPALTWVNVAGVGDVLASTPQPTQLPSLDDSTHRELEVLTIDGEPHSFIGYLKHQQIATAIAYAWCGAVTDTAPAECKQVRDVDPVKYHPDTSQVVKLSLGLGAGIGTLPTTVSGPEVWKRAPTFHAFGSLVSILLPVGLKFGGSYSHLESREDAMRGQLVSVFLTALIGKTVGPTYLYVSAGPGITATKDNGDCTTACRAFGLSTSVGAYWRTRIVIFYSELANEKARLTGAPVPLRVTPLHLGILVPGVWSTRRL